MKAALSLRLGAVAGALLYAALAVGSGLDRMTVDRPALAERVPDLFAVDALEVASESHLNSDPDAARIFAERLVGRAPVEPASTALLGSARYAAGDLAGADRAFRVAGQLGWRIPLTQAYWRQAALQLGDYTVAAQRLDALLRQSPQVLNSPAALAPFEANPVAQAALVDRLATRPPWLDAYVGKSDDGITADALARRLPSLTALADRGVVLGCDVIAPGVQVLIQAKMGNLADTLRQRHCLQR